MPERPDEAASRVAAQIPHPRRARRSVSRRELAEVGVGFLHQQRGARRGAPASDAGRVNDRDADPGTGEQVGDGGAGDPTANDRHLDRRRTLERWVTARR